MREQNFNTNAIFTSIAFTIILINFVINTNDQANIIILVTLGIFQVFTSFVLTIYSILKNKYLFTLFIIYWLLVILFFRFMLYNYFYSCTLIAIYNLYVHYCSFSNSKYNIIKHVTTF